MKSKTEFSHPFNLLLMALISLPALLSANSTASRPLVGAIRWDAWTGGSVTEQVERTLGPKRYHHRLPWFAGVTGEDTVKIDGGPQTVMDQEIEYAAAAGLDYWAFLVYPEENEMSLALKQYLHSAQRKQLRFCLILHSTLKAEEAAWPRERDRAVALLCEPDYQTVLDGRPLVYVFTGGGAKDFPFDRFNELLAEARKQGLDPYCAYMGWNPPADFAVVKDKGFDAVSAYAKAGDEAAFRELVESVEQTYWQAAAAARVPYIPLVTTGWDKRPRKDHPVSWEVGHRYHQQEVFPSQATPAEIALHLERAIAFVQTHRDICAAGAIIIYAWNENDEGGWLSPTRGPDGAPDTSRLDAIQPVLRHVE